MKLSLSLSSLYVWGGGICMCVCGYMPTHAHREDSRCWDCWMFSSVVCPGFCFWGSVSCWTWIHWFSLTGCVVSPRDPPHSCDWGYRRAPPCLGDLGIEGAHSGPHNHRAVSPATRLKTYSWQVVWLVGKVRAGEAVPHVHRNSCPEGSLGCWF